MRYIIILAIASALGFAVTPVAASGEDQVPAVYCGYETAQWILEARVAGSPTRFVDLQRHVEAIGWGNCMPPGQLPGSPADDDEPHTIPQKPTQPPLSCIYWREQCPQT